MKEATSELNMTLMVVIAVGGLVAFFYLTLWPVIRNNVYQNTACSKAICENTKNADGSVDCHYEDDKGNTVDILCAWKG